MSAKQNKNYLSVRAACALAACAFLVTAVVSVAAAATQAPSDPRLEKAYRFQRGGWTYVHLEGAPSEIGFQHGSLLAPEIADAFAAIQLFDTRETQRNWEFFRATAREMLWPHLDLEYQQELQALPTE